MTAAGAVSAAEVGGNDIATATLSGSLEAGLKYAPSVAENRSGEMSYGDAEIAVSAEALIYDDLTAYGSYVIDTDEGAKFLGLKGSWGQLEIGETDHAWDAGADAAVEFGGIDFTDDAFSGGKDVIRYDYSADSFSFGVSYDFESNLADTDANRVGVTASITASDAAVIGLDYTVSSGATDISAYGVKLTGSVSDFGYGASYTMFDVSTNDDSPSVITYYVTYGVTDATTVALGGQTITGTATVDTVTFEGGQAIYANVVHSLTDLVSVKAEIGNYSATDATTDKEIYAESLGFFVGGVIDF
jgi:hypothetical protein